MMKKTRQTESPIVPPSITPKQALVLLQQQIDKGNALIANRPITSAAERGWATVTKDILTRAFGSQSPHIEAVMGIGRYRNPFGGGNETEWEAGRAEDMQERLQVINDLLQLLQSEAGIACPSHGGEPFRLDQVLTRSDLLALVREDFQAGKYETAVFNAFRSLEEAVRAKAKQPASIIGMALMSAAFSPKGGVLKHPGAKVDAEADSLHQLMRGGIGWYKNPSSHRTVNYSDPQHAVQVLAFANLLLNLLDASV
jgi:uncharacterized protein (TIGR02391 family)